MRKSINRFYILAGVCICLLVTFAATPAFAYWANSGVVNPDPLTGSWASTSDCEGKTDWYCWAVSGNHRTANWNHGWTWAGRGYYTQKFLRHQAYRGSASNPLARSLNTSNNTSDASARTQTGGCGDLCAWLTLWYGAVDNVANRNGVRINTAENTNPCKAEGSSVTMVGQVHGYGDRWSYLNKWVVLGPFSSTSLASTNGLDEANLYLYPYIDATKGTVIFNGLFGGKRPEAHNAGDCNNANTLDFGAKWNYNANQAGYAMAWVYAPNGAGPRFAIGSDDGCKVWLNGTNIHTNDINRGLTRDQDVTGGKSMPAGWSRVLFKIQQGPGGGGWQGTISLRNGGDTNQEEPSVNFQTHRYDGYSIFNEQDGWFPKMTLSNFNGVSNPASGYTMYTNNTQVTASGTVTTQTIPFWKTGYYQWGRGLVDADEKYQFTTSDGASWSHTENNVTGYRRFHFFGISRSGRTSGQASGSSGGWTYNGTGNCHWCAVFVDNVAPNNPSFSSVNVVSPTQINLAWAIPLDKGVGVGDGATEDMNSTWHDTCHYRRGDVGVNVRRNNTSVYGWGTGTSFNNTGLTPNTQYTFDIAARDNTGQSRGAWANTTSYVGSTSVYTLSPAPVAGSVSPSTATPCQGENVVWTNNLGWGAGGVQYFRYAWDKNATHTWTDTETQWSSGTLSLAPTSGGTWYLHVKGYNAANVANGAFSYSVTATPTFSVGTITGGGGSDCGSIDPSEMTYSGGSGGGNLSYQWYSKLGDDSPTTSDTKITGATSASYDPPAGLTSTTTYNVLVTPTCGTAVFTATPVTVTVNPIPAIPTNASANARCGTGNVDFSATPASGCTVKWYSAATGGTVISSANPYTENLSATKTYYAASVSTAGCESATRLAVTGTVNDIPAVPTNASANARCGAGNVDFSVTPASGCTVKWYSAASGGTAFSTANPYTESLSATKTYYAASVSAAGCESATRLAVTGTVNEVPNAPTNASTNAICGSGAIDFSVTPASGCTVKWYSAATGGTVVSTDNPYTPTLSNTTTYYAASVSTAGCESATRLAVTGTVYTLPNTPTNALATPSTIGPGGSSALSATVGQGEEVVWYSGSCGGTVVTSPVSPTETTTYYAKAKNTTTGCLSTSCAQVTVTYIPDDEGPVLTNVTVTCSETGGAPSYNFLKGTVTVAAEVSDDSGVGSVVFVIDDSQTPITMTLDQNTGKYVGTCTIDADWTNGQHSIKVIATDIYNNESDETKNFPVNKNEIKGMVGWESGEDESCTRSVTFVINGTITKTLTLEFTNGKAPYDFVDVPEITSISAKTAWHLRSRREVTMTKGQAETNFLGPKVLRGGDLATPGKPMGDNVVNALDYAVLRSNWLSGAAGDINGDGITDNNDYLVMIKYLYVKGDEP